MRNIAVANLQPSRERKVGSGTFNFMKGRGVCEASWRRLLLTQGGSEGIRGSRPGMRGEERAFQVEGTACAKALRQETDTW